MWSIHRPWVLSTAWLWIYCKDKRWRHWFTSLFPACRLFKHKLYLSSYSLTFKFCFLKNSRQGRNEKAREETVEKHLLARPGGNDRAEFQEKATGQHWTGLVLETEKILFSLSSAKSILGMSASASATPTGELMFPKNDWLLAQGMSAMRTFWTDNLTGPELKPLSARPHPNQDS